jgi:rhodanese-related sulfurtransferase
MLTGDLLFVGDVGRPDLAGKELLEKQVKNLYESIYKKLGKLPDRLGVYPAHGQGSLCGKGISSKTSTTLGYERHANPLLRLDSLDEFKKSLMREYPDRPKSFSHIISMNMKGAPWLDKFNDDRPLTPLQFREALKRGAKIIDTRDASAYGGVHIPGSINIGFGSQMANWIGMAVEPESNILLVFTEDTKYRDMRSILYRIGYDNIIGYLQSGISAWQEQGFPIQRLPQISAQELRDEIKSSTYQYIIDVRSESEWNKGHIEEAELLPLSDMLLKEVDLPKEEKIIVTCRVGYRGSIGASYLQLHGYTNVHNLAGGMQAWSNAGLPLKV